MEDSFAEVGARPTNEKHMSVSLAQSVGGEAVVVSQVDGSIRVMRQPGDRTPNCIESNDLLNGPAVKRPKLFLMGHSQTLLTRPQVML